MQKLPEVRINYGFLLERIYKKLFEAGQKKEGENFPDKNEMFAKYGHFPGEWKKVEKVVLEAMGDVLELEFYQGVIDAHFVYSSGSMSSPMIIGVRTADETRFIDLMTHELIHRLLSDNTKKVPVMKVWNEMFPETEMTHLTRVHIVLHAVHEHIYREVLDAPERLAKDIAIAQKFPDYAASWKVVQERGYKNIIAEFKEKYV